MEKPPTRQIFVGRERQIQQFLGMLEAPHSWLMLISCVSGGGKTILLEKFSALCEKKRLYSKIVSFSSFAHRHKLSILKALCDSLSPAYFEAFIQAVAQHDQLVASDSASSTPNSRARVDIAEAETYAINAFVEDYARLALEQKPVLLFDSFEMIDGKGLGAWFLSELLPAIKEYAKIVVAGQHIQPWQGRSPGQDGVIDSKLENFSPAEIHAYFEQALENVPEDVASMIVKESEGRPLIVALAVDWLRLAFSLDDFVTYDPASTPLETWLTQRLVEHIKVRLNNEYLAILKMAHVYHPFDGEILMLLSEDIDEIAAPSILKKLDKYSFIKPGYEHEGYLLHDEMRRLLVEFVWNEIDWSATQRKEISERMIMYYDKKLSDEQSKSTRDQDPRRIETLITQRMYHLLYNEDQTAYNQFWIALYNAWNAGNFDFGDALLDVASRVNAQHSKANPPLERLITLGRALLTYARIQLNEALRLTDELIADPDEIKFILATGHWIRGLCLQWREENLAAIQSFSDALRLQNELADDLRRGNPLPRERGISTLATVQPGRLIVLNSLGTSYRITGRFDSALDYYTQALEQSRAVQDKVWEASALINLSQTHRWMGRYQDALDLAHLSLYLRRRLGLSHHEGITYNILGMLARDAGAYDQAREYFTRALDIFNEPQNKWRLGITYRNLGRLYHREHNYQEANRSYRRAYDLFNEINIRTEFPDLLHKMGLLEYTLGNAAQARQLLEQSLILARSLDYNLFVVNCLVDLSQIAFDTNEAERIDEYARNVKLLELNGYRFNPAYGQMEFIVGDVDLRNGQYDQAFDHYAAACRYLARFNERQLDNGLAVVREKLLGVPPTQRQLQARRLESFWRSEADLRDRYPTFILMCQRFAEEL